MDMHRQPYFPDELANQSRSLRSNCGPCSQPRKISRGILIDSPAKSRSKNVHREEAVITTEQCEIPHKSKSAEDGNRVGAVNAANAGKQSQALEQETSPWLYTRSFHPEMPITQAVRGTETTRVLLASTETHEVSCVAKEALETYSVQCFASRMPILEISQRQSDRVICGRKDNAADNTGAYATTQEIMVEDKTKKAKTRASETLRMKLWEILGTVSSPNKEDPNAYHLKADAKDSESLQKNNAECSTVLKARQNSDTIESDSEYANHTVGRLKTRSVSRRSSSNKLKANTTKKAPATYYTKDIEGKNTLSFKEKIPARVFDATSGGSSMLKKKNSEIQGSAVEACKTCSLEQENLGKKQELQIQREILPPGVKSQSHGNEGEDNKILQCGRESKFVEPKSTVLEKDSSQSPAIMMSENPSKVIDSPNLQENVDWQEDVGFSFLQKTMEETFNAQSPTFEMKTDKTPTRMSSPGFTPTVIKTPTETSSPDFPTNTDPGGQGDHSPTKMIFHTKGIESFKSLQASKSNEIKDDAGELGNTPTVNTGPVMEKEPKYRMSKSSSENRNSETSREGSRIKGCYELGSFFPKINTAEKVPVTLHLHKKQRYQDRSKTTRILPALSSRKGVEHTSKFLPHLELNQEDELSRAVALFALALKRVKSKMNSVVQKRSADILTSVAERIHLQLQKAESQIQADLGKLTSHSKSKRKRIELGCQELQQELNAIHERFKTDVEQHLQDYRSIVEGLEAHQMELNVTMDKQRVSHRQLLSQAKETIQTELNEAQRGLTAIQNSARGKMLQLKNILTDCLKEAHDGEIPVGNP